MKSRNNLDYLNNKPQYIQYEVIAGQTENLHPINLCDVVFDDYDWKIRQMEKPVEDTTVECHLNALGSSVVRLNHSEVHR